jgi:hypothetical protein
MRNIDENERDFEIDLSPDYKTEMPNLNIEIHAISLTFKYRIIPARIVENPKFDPYVSTKFHERYEYKNVVQNSRKLLSQHDLNLGFDTSLEPGKFYINPVLDFCYYCHDIKNNTATMLLLESYQHGTLLQAKFDMDIEVAKKFVEITNNAEVERLGKMLLKLEEIKKP